MIFHKVKEKYLTMKSDTNYYKPSWASSMLSSQRITALDMARFLAMIMMVQGHTIDALASRDFLDIHFFPWNVWDFLRGFTAQIFLIVSGMVQVFANKRLENGKLKPETIKKRITIATILIIIG